MFASIGTNKLDHFYACVSSAIRPGDYLTEFNTPADFAIRIVQSNKLHAPNSKWRVACLGIQTEVNKESGEYLNNKGKELYIRFSLVQPTQIYHKFINILQVMLVRKKDRTDSFLTNKFNKNILYCDIEKSDSYQAASIQLLDKDFNVASFITGETKLQLHFMQIA